MIFEQLTKTKINPSTFTSIIINNSRLISSEFKETIISVALPKKMLILSNNI